MSFGILSTCYVRMPGVDLQTALLAAIARSNRLLVSRLRGARP